MNLTHIMPRETSPTQKNIVCIVSFIPSSKNISNPEIRNEDSGYLWGGQEGKSRVVSGCWSHAIS